MKHDSSSVGSVRPGFKDIEGSIDSHQSNFYTVGAETLFCRVDFTQYQCYLGTNYLYLVFIFHQSQANNHWALLEQANNTQNFKIYTCTSVPAGPIQIIDSMNMVLVRTTETSFFVNNKRNPVWYISLGEYKELSIYIARKLNNIHNMCNLCSYYQCCSLYLHVY